MPGSVGGRWPAECCLAQDQRPNDCGGGTGVDEGTIMPNGEICPSWLLRAIHPESRSRGSPARNVRSLGVARKNTLEDSNGADNAQSQRVGLFPAACLAEEPEARSQLGSNWPSPGSESGVGSTIRSHAGRALNRCWISTGAPGWLSSSNTEDGMMIPPKSDWRRSSCPIRVR